jgi:uncharacterized protein
MEYREYGKTGLKVSVVGLGCQELQGKTQEEAIDIVHTAVNSGINFFDALVPDTTTRDRFGAAIAGLRDKIILQGHFGMPWEENSDEDQWIIPRTLDGCIRSLEDFLTRSRTDHVETLMLTLVDDMENWDQAVKDGLIDYMLGLKRQGICQGIGITCHEPLTAWEIVNTGMIDVIQFSINPLFDLFNSPFESIFADIQDLDKFQTHQYTIDENRSRLYALCKEKGVSISVMKTLAAGRLLDTRTSLFGKAMTVPQCIHYALNRPAVATSLIGCNNADEVRIAAAYNKLSAAEKDYTEVLSVFRFTGLDRCMYCNHCLPCPAHIDIASVKRLLDSARIEMTGALRNQYNALDKKASDCLSCETCMKRCPFGVDVVASMREAEKLFN